MWPSRSTLTRATAVAVVLGALLVVGRLTGDSLRPPSPATTTRWHPPPVLPPPPTTPSPVTAHLRLGRVTAVAAERNAVWAAHGCAVSRVDPHTNRVVATLALVGVGAPVVTDVGVWAECCWTGINTAHPTGSLVRVDPASNRVVATIRIPGGLGGLPHEGPAGEAGDVLVGPDAVWVSNPASGQVLRVDPARNRQVRAVFEDAPSLVGESLVAAGGEVWATSGTTLLALGDTSRQVSLDELGGPDDSAPVSDLAAS